MKRLLWIAISIVVISASFFEADAQSITASAVTGAISACAGTASASPNMQQFTVSGNGLTTGITANAPAGFLVSLSAGSGYSSSVIVAQTGGTAANTVIYVTSAATAAPGNPTGNVILSSAGATSQNVAVEATINALPTVNPVNNQTVNNGAMATAINFTGTGATFSWGNDSPGIGLAAGGIGNIPSFTAVNAGASPVTATITVNAQFKVLAYLPNESGSTVSVINIATNKVISTIAVGGAPFAVAVSPDGSRVYVGCYGSNTISVISTATNTVIATIPGSSQPFGVAVSPDGSKLYVANNAAGTVSVINTATFALIATIPTGSGPYGIAVSPDGSRVYVANYSSSTVSVINATTNTVVTSVPVGTQPIGLAVSPGGNEVYVSNGFSNNVSVINTGTNSVTATIPVGQAPNAITIGNNGNFAYVTNQETNNVSVINTSTNTVVATIPVGLGPFGSSLSPDGSMLYIPDEDLNTISVISTTTNKVITTLAEGSNPSAIGNFIVESTACSSMPMTFTITVNSTAPPTITADTATGIISACAGTASASPNIQQFTVSGNSLTGNITATAPAGFELSLTSAGGYSSSVTLTQSGGTVTGTVIYVRMAATALTGAVSGNVTLSSAGSTSQTVAVSGVVNTPVTVNPVPNQVVNNGATSPGVTFTGSGSSFTWVNDTPAIGLAASGAGNITPFKAVNTGTTPVTATITVTPSTASFAYITNYGSGTVSVINTATNQVDTTIFVGALPVGVAVNANRTYVANYNDNTVSVIDNTKNAVIATISSGISNPYGITVSPDGGTLYVGNSSGVAAINTATYALIANIPLPNVNGSGLAVSPGGGTLYVSDSGSLAVINTATNAVVANIPNAGGNGIATSPDGSRVYVAAGGDAGSIKTISAATNTIINTIPVDSVSLEGICVSPDGSRVYAAGTILSSDASKTAGVVLVINTATNKIIDTIGFDYGLNAFGVSITPDGSRLYVANDNTDGLGTVMVISTASNSTLFTVPAGANPVAFGNFITPGSGCSTPSSFTITVNPPAFIAAGKASGAISACAGAPSASPAVQQFVAYGQYGTGDITVTAPTGFEVSLSANSGYGPTVTLVQANDSVSHTTVYVRSSASAAAGALSGYVTLSSASAPSQTVAVSGVVNALPVINTIADQNATNGTLTAEIGFTGTGDSYSWTNSNPAIGLAASGSGDMPPFTALNPSGTPAIATISVTPSSAVTGCTGLPQSFTITVANPLLEPKIIAGGSLSPLNTIYGTPSASTTFSVSGSNLNAQIQVNPPTGFELSTDGAIFSNSVNISTADAASQTTIYIRLAATTPVDSYSGNIQLTSTNATTVDLAMPLSTVSPAPLTVTADNKTRFFDQANPIFTATYSGFVNQDGPAQLTAQPTFTTPAVTTSPVGEYPINVSGAASPNYTITFVPGLLTITPLPSNLVIPNTFTPNGDGINDTWNIKYLDLYPNCFVQVFSRWGKKVFSSTGYSVPWDGAYRGARLATGTYYYIIDLKNGSGLLSGWVAILR